MKKGLSVLLMLGLIFTSGNSAFAVSPPIEAQSKDGVIKVTKPVLKKGETAYVRIRKKDKFYSFPLRKNETIPNPYGNGEIEVLIATYDGKRYWTKDVQYVTLKATELNRTQQSTILSPGKSAYGVEKVLSSKFKGWQKWSSKTKVKKVHEYVTKTYRYDYQRQGNQGSWYIPDYNRFMKNKKGTCYDIASLTSSLLREMKVPTRLTMGYPKGDSYHAWNEVYVDKKWKVIDTTYDLQRKVSTPYKKASDYKVKYRF